MDSKKAEVAPEMIVYATRLGEEVMIDNIAKAVKTNSRKIATDILKKFDIKIIISTDAKGVANLTTSLERKK